MISRLIVVLVAALLVACGGGGSSTTPVVPPTPVVLPPPPLGWWGISPYDIASAPGTIAVVSALTEAEAEAAIDAAVAAHRTPWLITWGLTDNTTSLTGSGWQARLAQIVAARGSKIACYYIADEPTAYGWTIEQIAQVAAALPAASCKVVSIAANELSMNLAGAGITMVGLNMYTSHGSTPSTAIPLLNQLATMNLDMYIDLDMIIEGYPNCSSVTAARQQQSIDLNNAELAWASTNPRVKAQIGFVWRSEAPWCATMDLPVLRSWVSK